ncbi:hypothetical protein DAEQUDRAFT_700825 [Daedalea quercina L-15889]|uniref:MIT domain-containing protein n=1 Tax=Daedalea quercina L-15889 TaxID=1314783 RepID=A0A165UE97_9APHY|nr:hypothetical protein DAEQUDRAFT_700825 [Daedalea quercina L-15889]
MELEYQTQPIPIVHQSRPWQNQDIVGSSAVPASTSTFVSRRRSVVNHAPPPGPPPTQPIPSVPGLPAMQYGTYDRVPGASEYDNGTSSQIHAYSRPSGSPNLAAIASYSQARLAAASSSGQSPPPSASSSSDNLSDPPPRSMLRANIPPRQPSSAHDIVPDRLLLSPPEPRPSESRPSSRRALTKALELAREAVRLDSSNDDPYAAVVAYGQSVALLSQVMERVMRGEDSTESHRKQGRRRSVVAQEEEVRRLKSIHDTYADRMNILSSIYSIPLPQHSQDSPPSIHSSSYSQSSNSTRPSSPASPTSDSSESGLARASVRRRSREVPRYSGDTVRAQERDDDELSAEDAIGTALSTSTTVLTGGRVPSASSPAAHPYASSASSALSPASASSAAARVSATPAVRPLRTRASSILPPAAPPPTTTLPPTPGPPAELTGLPNLLTAPDPGRLRGSSVSHSRNNSGSRLSALREDRREDGLPSSEHAYSEEHSRSRSRTLVYPHDHPLPPLPTPSPLEAAATPRIHGANGQVSEPASPHAGSHFTTPRPRGGSTLSTRSEATPTKMPPLINTSPVLGTISQRRGKTSAPPSSTTSSSPTDSTASVASVPNMGRLATTLPASTMNSLGMAGRNRASSQPGRRPSVAGSYFPAGATALPNTAPVPRKASTSSRLNPNAPPSISINTALMSPPLGSMAPLVPPPPIPHTNIPTAPLSPLPSLAPPDPFRKPYHMMTLLRQTMTSKTGGYITRRLHVPQEVWSQGGAKLTNIPEKIRVVEVLCSALEELQNWSVEYFGAGNVSSGMALGIGAIGRREGEAWSTKMEDFANVCDGVVGSFGKKLGVGEGFVMKKSSGMTSWGGKLTRQLDKFTNGKNLDSPASYVQGLSKLFQMVQILDEHTKAAISVPPAPLYAAFPIDVRQGLEFKLRHSSEFFAKVVLTFVIGDLSLLLDKYVKKCEKWLAE